MLAALAPAFRDVMAGFVESERFLNAMKPGAPAVAGALGKVLAVPAKRGSAAEKKKGEAELIDELFEGADEDGEAHYGQILGGPSGLSGADQGGTKPKSSPDPFPASRC